MKWTLFVAISMIFLFAGCSFLNLPGSNTAQATGLTGTEGLVINLPKGVDGTTLAEGQGMELPIMLENAGTYPVRNGILAISGYDPQYVTFTSPIKYEGISLDARSATVPAGEQTTEIFSIGSVSAPGGQKKETFNVLGCYQYRTQASPVVCINPQLAFGSTVTQGCTFQDGQVASSQGAPVAVTKVQTLYLSSKKQVAFDIFVKDVSGTGAIVAPSAYSKPCLGTTALQKSEQNTIFIEAYLSGQKLDCYAPGTTTPIDHFTYAGDSTVAARCVASIDPNEAGFTTPLSISLDYGYASGKVFSITISNPSKA